jgi:micrococcal nuclease
MKTLALAAIAALLLLAGHAAAAEPQLPESAVQVEVLEVIDGDTIRVRLGEAEELVRIIGASTPETREKKGKAWSEVYRYCGREATDTLARLLAESPSVHLEQDPATPDRDKHGRLLRHVWYHDDWGVYQGPRLAGATLLRLGVAWEKHYEQHRYLVKYQGAQAKARLEFRGLWHDEKLLEASGYPLAHQVGDELAAILAIEVPRIVCAPPPKK